MNQNKTIGGNIKHFRENLKITQADLASYLGVTREEVSYYETGARNIPTEVIAKAAKLFGVEEYDLYEADIEKHNAGVALAFRAESLVPEDLNHIANFRKIVMNYLNMKKALTHEPISIREESE